MILYLKHEETLVSCVELFRSRIHMNVGNGNQFFREHDFRLVKNNGQG